MGEFVRRPAPPKPIGEFVASICRSKYHSFGVRLPASSDEKRLIGPDIASPFMRGGIRVTGSLKALQEICRFLGLAARGCRSL